MKVFAFKPTNALIGAFRIHHIDDIHNAVEQFGETKALGAYDYFECVGRVWTLVPGPDGLKLQEGVVERPKPQSSASGGGGDRLPSITDATHCQVSYGGQQFGPYVLQQIRSMWTAGTITADASILPAGYPDWIPITDFLARYTPIETCPPVSSPTKRPLGWILGICGICLTIYFAAVYDTTVVSERRYFPGIGGVGGEKVVNLGKQENRLIGVIVGISMTAIGVLVICLPSRSENA